MTVHIAISYGMGGAKLDTAYGERYLLERLHKLPAVDTMRSIYQWSDTQLRFNDYRNAKAHDPHGKIAIIGDSLGDNEIGDDLQYLEQVGIEVDLVVGFQGSVYGKHTTVTGNCKRAMLIYNPVWLQTIGLGDYPLPLQTPPPLKPDENLYDGRWRLGNNGRTWVRYVQIEAPHPDDWGQAQDLAFAEVQALVA